MIRNYGALGLLLAAGLAVSATVVPAASAQQGKLTSDGPVTLIGAQREGAKPNAATLTIGTTECSTISYTGHRYNATPHERIASGASTFTVTPHYAKCTSPFPMTWDMNGCDYVFHIGQTASGEHTYGISADLVCPVAAHVQVTVFNESHTLRICTITMPPQSGVTGLHIATETNTDSLKLVGTLSFQGEQSGLCGPEKSSMSVDFDQIVKGFNVLGKETGITITD
jgi:hypothetical protein